MGAQFREAPRKLFHVYTSDSTIEEARCYACNRSGYGTYSMCAFEDLSRRPCEPVGIAFKR